MIKGYAFLESPNKKTQEYLLWQLFYYAYK